MKKFIFLIIAVSINSTVFAAYDQALSLYQEKKYQESLSILGNDLILAEDYKPGSPNYKIRFLAAHNHWKLGNVESASIHFRKCMAIDKTKVDPYIDLALLLTEKGKLREASSVIEDGLRVKEDAYLLWILGRIAIEKKDYVRAKDLIERANGIDPELYFSYNDLGIALMKLGKFGEANAAFSVAYAINPDSAEINSNIALSLLKMGKNTEALNYAKKAQELLPESEKIKKLIQRIENK